MKSIKSKFTSNIQGEMSVPGDKSISHRALILGSCVVGKTTISNLLESDDVFSTLNALKTLGIDIIKEDQKWIVHGNGLGSISGEHKSIFLGNSGTGARLFNGFSSRLRHNCYFYWR